MTTDTIDAETAFGLMFELFKAKPWLTDPGVMSPQDAPAEAEAVAFLLTAEQADDWGKTSPAARRVACSLLVDFMAKLHMPESSISRSTWRVTPDNQAWRQALEVVAHEIHKSHPQTRLRH